MNKKSSTQAHKVVRENALHYDQVTALPNRFFFMETLQDFIQKAKRNSAEFALLFIDINKFHQVNADYGNVVGDKILNKVASILKRASRKVDFVAKVGDDEFVVLIDDITIGATISDVASRIIDLFKSPLSVDKHNIQIEVSIGISIYPKSGVTQDELLNNAVRALQSAKKINGSIYVFYSKNLDNRDNKAIEIETSLINAIDNNELNLVYQPIIDVVDNKINAFEVLLRWQSKDLGVIDPDIFVQIAEKQGIMANIGEWVFSNALKEYANWVKDNPDIDLPCISINCSVCHFKNKSFFKKILKQLKDLNISHDKLIIEITETMIFDNKQAIHTQIKDLHADNIQIAIDDFGTGYSSLSHFKNIPISSLKIDKSFITNITYDNNDDAVVGSILHLGDKLNLHIVAEGVETEEQVAFLKAKGCRLMQGFVFSKPLKSHDFIDFLRKFN